MSVPEVLVVGGGVVGAACARALAHRGVTVMVVDAGPKSGVATQAAAGMLAPFAEAISEDPLLSLTVRARDWYRDVAQALWEETGIDIGLWTDGILQIAFTDAEAAEAKNAIAWQRQSGFAADWLSAEDLRERVPGIAEDAMGAVLAPEDGALEPIPLLAALLDSAEARGARLVKGERVEEVLFANGKVSGVRTTAERRSCAHLILAAGCWTGRIGGLPRPVSVEPIRGQMVALPWPNGEPPAVVYGAGGYVVYRGGEAIAGSTMEHVGFDTSVTPEGVRRILQSARRIYPALADAEVLRSWAGLRPGTPDGRPMLGRDPEIPNLWYATGHGRNGILLAGLTGEILGRLFLGETVEHDLEPLDPGRFWTA